MERKKAMQFLKNFIQESKDENKDGLLCVFTDIDGTIIPEANASFDKLFIYTIQRIKTRLDNKLLFMANTGRTPNDVKNTIKQSKINRPIKLFTSILGNNGATSEYKNYFIDQHEADEILRMFIYYGGKTDNIRFATENDIYIDNNKLAKDYYAKRGKQVNVAKRIIRDAFDSHLTKITLTAEQKTIDLLSQHIKEKGYRINIHEGNSSYRQKNGKKIRRADLTHKDCSKGEVLKTVLRETEMKSFIVMGNDENDISMFEAAIDEGGYIVLVENSNPRITEKLQEQIAEYSNRKRVE